MAFTYPYTGDDITFTQANWLVAEALWRDRKEQGLETTYFHSPSQIKNGIRKAVRLRVRRAQQNEELPEGDVLPAQKFFRWAIHQDEVWRAALLKCEGLPIEPLVEHRDARIDVKVSMECGVYVRPGDESVRDELLLALQVELEQARADQRELEKYREGEEQRRRQNSENAMKKRTRKMSG